MSDNLTALLQFGGAKKKGARKMEQLELFPNPHAQASPPPTRYVYVLRSAHGLKIGRTDDIDKRRGQYETHNAHFDFIRTFPCNGRGVQVALEGTCKRATIAYVLPTRGRRTEWRTDDPRVLDIIDRQAIKFLGSPAVIESEAHVRRLHASKEWQDRVAGLKEAA